MRESTDEEAGQCQRPHPDFVGMCTSPFDNFHCTGHSSGCVVWEMFVPNVPYCSLQYNHFRGRDIHLALYGTCENATMNTKACVWSLDDCPGAGINDDITYTPTSYSDMENVDSLCTCDKVSTGACAFGEDWTCAISAEACDEESEFRTREEVLATGRDCRLCPLFDKNSPEAISTGNLWMSGHRDRNDDNNNHQHNNQSDPLHEETCTGGIVAGATAGVLVAIGAALAIDSLCRRRCSGNGRSRSTAHERQANGSATVPPEATLDDGELAPTENGRLA